MCILRWRFQHEQNFEPDILSNIFCAWSPFCSILSIAIDSMTQKSSSIHFASSDDHPCIHLSLVHLSITVVTVCFLAKLATMSSTPTAEVSTPRLGEPQQLPKSDDLRGVPAFPNFVAILSQLKSNADGLAFPLSPAVSHRLGLNLFRQIISLPAWCDSLL